METSARAPAAGACMSCGTVARRLDAHRPTELHIPRATMVLVYVVHRACTYPYTFEFGPVRVARAVARLTRDLGVTHGLMSVCDERGVPVPLTSHVAHDSTLYVYTF